MCVCECVCAITEPVQRLMVHKPGALKMVKNSLFDATSLWAAKSFQKLLQLSSSVSMIFRSDPRLSVECASSSPLVECDGISGGLITPSTSSIDDDDSSISMREFCRDLCVET